MDKNSALRKEIIEVWERYLNKTNTRDDFERILELFRDDRLQEFNEVADRMWDKVMNELSPTPEEKEIYRKEFAQIFAEYRSRRKNQKRRILPGNFRKIWYAAAAALLLGLLIPAVNMYVKPKTEQTVQYVEEVTGRGEVKTVFLPDLTEVTLNAESRLKYHAGFTGDERSVELAGEALFNVTSDPARPFIVSTENMNIKVTGTVFDVKDYADDLLSSVSVASGKVEVETWHATSKEHAASILLEQNHQVKMNKATGDVETMIIDAGNYLLWTDGTLYFDRTPIREVVNVLNRHFPKVDIELDEGEYSFLISGEYESTFTVEVILKSILVITGLKCKKTGSKYSLYSEK